MKHALALLISTALATPALADRFALVVGVQAYQNLPDLRTAHADARDMATRLEAGGYAVTELRDPTELDFLDAFYSLLGAMDPGDDLFMYFGGQGFHHAGRDHVLFADQQPLTGGDVGALARAGLTIDWLQTRIMDGGIGRVSILVSDACRDFLHDDDRRFGRPPRPVDPTRRGPSQRDGVKSLTGAEPEPSGSFVVYSTSIGSCALETVDVEDPQRNALFTGVLVEQLRWLGRPIQEIVAETRREVLEQARSVDFHQRVEVRDTLDQPYVIVPSR